MPINQLKLRFLLLPHIQNVSFNEDANQVEENISFSEAINHGNEDSINDNQDLSNFHNSNIEATSYDNISIDKDDMEIKELIQNIPNKTAPFKNSFQVVSDTKKACMANPTIGDQ